MTNLKPGRELDALIAEKVMGFKVCTCELDKRLESLARHNEKIKLDTAAARTPVVCVYCEAPQLFINHYSTDLKAAWEVVEKIQCRHFCVSWHLDPYSFTRAYKAEFQIGSSNGETAPHAICLAALKAVGYE